MRKTEAQWQEDFNTITTVRLALIFAGLGIEPEKNAIMRTVIAISTETPSETEPQDADWNLYFLEVENPCPIHRLMMPRWLVQGILALTENNEYPIQNIDPAAWITNLPATLEKMPKLLVDNAVRLMASNLIQAEKHCDPTILPRLREAIKIKGEAIKNNTPCPDGDEDETLNVVIIGL